MHLLILFGLSPHNRCSHKLIPSLDPTISIDVRSPCLALNKIANHGIIPHDGRGLTIRMLQEALGDTYNIGLDLRLLLLSVVYSLHLIHSKALSIFRTSRNTTSLNTMHHCYVPILGSLVDGQHDS